MSKIIVLTTENIGETIKAIRMEKNITQTDLASMCGVTEKTIRIVENGYGHSPTIGLVFKIFQVLGKKVVLK